MADTIINYSIIIAHKNIPLLLMRCLASIPVRDDIQVIVVDDNSDSEIVSFDHFPKWGGKRYDCYFTKEGRGAGYAWNVGLAHAEGKWITFLDADDFYTEGFSSFLDRMVDAEEDLIYFDHRSVLSTDISVTVERSGYLSRLIENYLAGRIDENRLRREFGVMWCKLYRREMIERYNIRTRETIWASDCYFSALAACFARSIRVCDDVLYVLTVRDHSLTSNYCGTRKEAMTRLQEAIASDRLFREHGLGSGNELTHILLGAIHRRHTFFECATYCLVSITNRPVFRAMACSLLRKSINHCRNLFK